MLTLGAGRHQGVEGGGVGGDAIPLHLIQQVQGQLPAACPVAGQDQAAVGDHIAIQALLHLRRQECSGLRHLLLFCVFSPMHCPRLRYLPYLLKDWAANLSDEA